MGELTEERVATIVRDVMHRELTDPDSMFRMVLERSFIAWGKQLKAEVQEVIQPVAIKAEAALDLQQQQNSTKRLKDNTLYWLEVAGKVIVVGIALYGLYRFLQTH